MLFVVRFTDKPGSLALRQQLLTEHLRWLEEHQDVVRVAGSLRPEPSDPPVGACWVVEEKSNAAVENLLKADPFWTGGLRASYEILHWSKAFPDRKVSI